MTEDTKYTMFQNRLTKVYRHLSKTARRQGMSCYRIYDHDLSEFPFSIEVYDQKIYVAEYKRKHNLSDEAHEFWMRKSVEVIAQVLQISKDKIYTKIRQRKPGRLGQYQKTDATKNEFIVLENGLKFIVNLDDYLDTGLFLDHRITRKMVMEQSANKRVLNLFAYTGSFSVYAAAGDASQVTTVDLSNTYINWAQRNMALNQFTDPEKYKFIAADVLQYLKALPVSSFDLIVMDPPTFSNSKKMDDILDIQRDHVSLINDCINTLSPGGQLYFSNNYTKFLLDEKNIKAFSIKDITKTTTPFDFEGKLQRSCFLLQKEQ
ncbi:MAG TPA: class I SAM-dependent methyltransferase [Niabella sp.]|nr:class I SAM-dependent methyltransferase [Niabella sp.]HQW14222.1 class I SAM-dependent methyltransferase [Niabella sp.]HQX19622.1 class I SAM-dependent methyltransferase [Niabella sp.]HQX39944.1 class I SAM-dependent methyltransferase [Niabella sp.]HRB06937.1 class I SAM-dependent methyltransferase [Niabella sp.]